MVRRSAVVAQVFGSLLYNSLLLPVTWSLPGPGQLSGFYNHHRSQARLHKFPSMVKSF